MKQRVEICIFGAGPAGAATALRLADLGASPVVFDRPSAKKRWGGESFTGAIRQPLRTLGLWDDFCAAGHVAGYEQRAAWGGPELTTDSIHNKHGNLWHVDRNRFDGDLRKALKARDIPIINYASLDTLRREGNEWRLEFAQSHEISARYLVDATGRACAIARKLGVRPRLYDRLLAFAALVPRNQNPEFDHAMVIESMPQGWWYAAPVPQGHVLAFFTDADLAPRELARSMKTVPANSAFTDFENGQGWLGVGDACAAHDPLCGSGVLRGMTNGIFAADAIAGYLKTADGSLLNDYRQHCLKQFAQYLAGLTKHYSYERRWAAFPFWERRAQSVVFQS
jgi:flavin-dependent dehydrogenase